MKIKALILIFGSKPDRAGNSYYFFRYIETMTGKMVEGKVSGGTPSNIQALPRELGLNWDEVVVTSPHYLGIRQYDRLIKDMDYAGCNQESLAAYINKKLSE